MPSIAEEVINLLEEQRNRFFSTEKQSAPDPVRTGEQAHLVTVPMKLADGLTYDVGFVRTDITHLVNRQGED